MKMFRTVVIRGALLGLTAFRKLLEQIPVMGESETGKCQICGETKPMEELGVVLLAFFIHGLPVPQQRVTCEDQTCFELAKMQLEESAKDAIEAHEAMCPLKDREGA